LEDDFYIGMQGNIYPAWVYFSLYVWLDLGKWYSGAWMSLRKLCSVFLGPSMI